MIINSIRNLFKKPKKETRYIDIYRMDYESYKKLEVKASVTNKVPQTELEAGYALGVQAVLKELREGYVIGA